MRLAQFSDICHGCDYLDLSIAGSMLPCKKNGRPFIENCSSGECPDERFTPDQLFKSMEPPKPAEPTHGVGTEIKALLSSLHIVENTGCGCTAKAGEWDANGIEWCEQHQTELADYLIEQGKSRGWLFGVAAQLSAGKIVSMAIERAKDHFASGGK